MSSSSSENHSAADIEKAVADALAHLVSYVRSKSFSGIDPYDALTSPVLSSLPGKWSKIAATQLFVYSPIDLRRLFKVPEGRNPKAIALFLSSYCRMMGAGLISERHLAAVSEELTRYLYASSINGFTGN
jgi:hypothetical protein